MRTAVRLHLRNQTMYLPTVSFRVLPSYVLWAYFIMGTLQGFFGIDMMDDGNALEKSNQMVSHKLEALKTYSDMRMVIGVVILYIP